MAFADIAAHRLDPIAQAAIAEVSQQGLSQSLALWQLSRQAPPSSVAKALINIRLKEAKKSKNLMTVKRQLGTDRLMVPKYTFVPLVDVQRKYHEQHVSCNTGPTCLETTDSDVPKSKDAIPQPDQSAKQSGLASSTRGTKRKLRHRRNLRPSKVSLNIPIDSSSDSSSWFSSQAKLQTPSADAKDDEQLKASGRRNLFTFVWRRANLKKTCLEHNLNNADASLKSRASKRSPFAKSSSNPKVHSSRCSYAHDDYVDFITGRQSSQWNRLKRRVIPKVFSRTKNAA